VHEKPLLLGHLTRVLAQTPPRQALPLRLSLAFAEILGAQGAAITLGFDVAERATLCATDEVIDRAEDSQDLLREGPSLDAFRTRTAVCGLSWSEQTERWPNLTRTLDPHGDGPGGDRPVALHAFPMRAESEVVGVISAYQTHERGLQRSCEEAQFLADAIAVAVLGGVDSGNDDAVFWAVRDRISQATGMVVAQLRISPVDALALLRAHAFAHGTTVTEVSGRILSRELDFTTETGGEI
jgi:hypothetical protein